MRNLRYFIILVLLLSIIRLYVTYDEYKSIEETQKNIILKESQSLAKFIFSFRSTYQNAFIKNHIEINEKTLKLLPVKTMNEINRNFSTLSKENINIRVVSDNPRNIKNLANDFELESIQAFRKDSQKKYSFTKKDNIYYYTTPLRIKESCLECHGKREAAPDIIRKKYSKAYNYKIGDIRGLLNIQIKNSKVLESIYSNFYNMFINALLPFIIFIGVIYYLLKKIQEKDHQYMEDLEREIEKKVTEVDKQKDTFETLFEKSSDGLLILNNGEFIQCNEKIVEMFQYDSKDDILNLHPSKLSPEFQLDGESSYDKAEKMIDLAIKNDGYQFEWIYVRSNGDAFPAEITLTPIILNNEKVLHVVIRDISDKKRAQQEIIKQKDILYHQVHHDILTGLPNRILFNDRLEHSIEIAKRNKTKIALLFLDLDRFKQINDSLGHPVGDKVLIAVTKLLKSKLRKKDTLARLGGDEFTIIMDDMKDEHDVVLLVQKIIKILNEPIYVDGRTLYISCSMGISVYPKDGSNVSDLVKYADAAMYKAKEQGRNNYQFYASEMTLMAHNRVVLESNLRKAIKNEEFMVFYQPQIEATTEKLLGMEALIRWADPVMGLVPPDKFIPLAEETGMIVQIDRLVMKMAMSKISKWYKQGLKPGILSLNLSMRQLESKDFIEMLEKTMASFNFNPLWLEFEIIESHMMKNPEEIIPKLEMINKMGITIAIDDFGTGYSSLAYLKRLPVDKLKIDQSFIQGIPDDQEDVSIVKAMIALADSLKLNVIAEGVETKEQKDYLVSYGCIKIQGYYYSKPLESNDLEEKYLKK